MERFRSEARLTQKKKKKKKRVCVRYLNLLQRAKAIVSDLKDHREWTEHGHKAESAADCLKCKIAAHPDFSGPGFVE